MFVGFDFNKKEEKVFYKYEQFKNIKYYTI